MLADEMKKVLSNTFMFYYKAHAAHWNVEGMLFASLHEFFGTLYEDLHDAVDPIAEHIRALGVYAPFSLSTLMEESEVSEDTSVYETRDMIAGLIAANDLVRASLYRARGAADMEKESGVINFLEERIDKHDKWSWMLKSHLE
jgi:starvation-inducible DNA-binding protein